HDTYGLHPFVAEYFRGLLGATAASLHALFLERPTQEPGRQVIEQRWGASLARHAPSPIDPNVLNASELLLEHTLRSGDAEGAIRIYWRQLGGFTHLGLNLGAFGRGARILRTFCREGDPARTPEGLAHGQRWRIAYDLGLYTGALGDLELALRCYVACNALA